MIHAPLDAATAADQILNQAELLYRSLHAGDPEVALRHARDLKAGADSICMRLTPVVFSPMAKAKRDLAAILARKEVAK